MKRKLLSFFALAFVAMGMSAQTWTKPTIGGVVTPYAVSLEDHLTPEAELTTSLDVANAVYLYNVVGEGFLGGGNSWNTRASFKVTSGNNGDLPYFISDVTEEGSEETVYKLFSPKAGNNHLLFRDDEVNCWVDLGNQNKGFTWLILKQDNGYYRIKSPREDPNYGVEVRANWEYEYLGYDGAGDNNLISANIDPRVEGVGVDWLIISPEGLEAYKNAAPLVDARTALYNLAKIIVDEELGKYGVTYEEYTEVYNGTDVNAINAAATELSTKVLEARKAKAWAEGSEDNPTDVSFLLTNPNFNGSANGWTVDVPGGQNKGYQSAGYTNDIDDAETNPNFGVKISGFIEAWHPSNGLGNGKIYQTVELPMGKYVLAVDVIATNQVGTDLESSRETVEGFQLYALGGGIDNGVDVRSCNGKPEHYEFEFITAGGTTELGMRMVNATGNWFGADNFTVKYKGNDIDPYFFGLPQLITSCENEIANVDDIVANSELKDAYNEALEAAVAQAQETEGDFEGVYKALSAAFDALKASVADYTKLKALVEKAQQDVEDYSDFTFGETLGGMYDEYSAAYEDETATGEQIEAWTTSYDATVVEGVKASFAEASEEKPLKVSALAKNLNYANNSTEEGWTCSSSAYKVNYHNGEVWQASFSCLQTLSDMPVGKYNITAQAFYRSAPNAENYEAYLNGTNEITTYLVAGSSKVPVPDLALGAVNELPEGSNYAETAEGSGIFMPNSQQAAEWAFNNTDVYNCEVSTYLSNEGDLVFGTRNDDIVEANNQWSVWTNFNIYYYGKSLSALYDQLVQLTDQARSMNDSGKADMVVAGGEKLNEAINAGENAQPTDSEEALTAVINQITEAMDYVTEGRALATQLMDIVALYSAKMSESDIVSSDESLDALMAEVNPAIAAEVFESNEKLQEWMTALPAAWVAYVMGQDMSSASQDEPVDITAILFNPDFESGNANYWTVDALGQNNGFQNNNTYTNEDDSENVITLSNFIECWRPNGADVHLDNGAVSQKLGAALPEGYYELSVDAHAVNQYGYPDGGIKGVSLAVVGGANTYATEFGMESAKPEHISVQFYSDGTSVLTVGIFINECNINWFAADNFKLSYIGAKPGDGVEGVEAEVPAMKTTGIYNLAGQRVQKAVRGLYIINGKKIVVK